MKKAGAPMTASAIVPLNIPRSLRQSRAALFLPHEQEVERFGFFAVMAP